MSEAALRLQDAGAIRYRRGHIQILDRDWLERRACPCYAIVKDEYHRLLRPDLRTREGRARLDRAMAGRRAPTGDFAELVAKRDTLLALA